VLERQTEIGQNRALDGGRQGGQAVTNDEREHPAVHPKHLTHDRFGKGALLAAHGITEGLAEAGADDDGAVVLRTDGKRHNFAQLEALIDDALADEEDARTRETGQ
jgi:hypothetical protein